MLVGIGRFSVHASPNDSSFVVWRDLKNAGNDAAQIASDVGSLDSRSFTYVAIGSGVIASVVLLDLSTTFDVRIRQAMLNQRSSSTDRIMSIADAYGETKYALLGGGALYVGGIVLGDESIRTTGRLLFESLVVSGIVTTSLKYILGRARPYMDLGQGSFMPFPGLSNDGRFSLPSGHTTVAFTVSTVLAKRIDNLYASIGLYTAASMTGLARMYYDKHWLTDVLAGAAVGYLSASLITNIHQRGSDSKALENNSSTFKMYCTPTIGGISFTAMW